MKAMIFAAGFGTRLGSLTATKPKALVEVNGKPMLEHVVDYLKKYSITDVIINVHHFAEMIFDYVKQRNQFDLNIAFSDESEQLLDTGGGLMKAAWFFNNSDPFILHNVDILSQTNLQDVVAKHIKSHALSTLVTKNRVTSRYLLLDSEGTLCGWKNNNTGEQIIVKDATPLTELAYSGIQVVNPKIFSLYNKSGRFSLTPMYLELAKTNLITTYQDDGLWFDLGKPESIKEAEAVFFKL
ncbi:MAG: nucleotidyltransferase family protein [Bacteroidota bacterium]